MSEPHLTNALDVAAGLRSADLVPPLGPASLGDGATSALRAGMARFSSGDAHDAPRRQVESAIARIDPAAASAMAGELTEAILSRSALDLLTDVGFVVPTDCLALLLGVVDADLESVRADVVNIVSVIGRQQLASDVSDAAADRLVDRFALHPDGPVASVSMLYQNHDATAALFSATVLAGLEGRARRSALARTVRVATSTVSIGSTAVANGEMVTLSLEDPANEFGAGPHECPGRRLTQAIVDGMTAALAASGRSVDIERIERSPDGRASALPVIGF